MCDWRRKDHVAAIIWNSIARLSKFSAVVDRHRNIGRLYAKSTSIDAGGSITAAIEQDFLGERSTHKLKEGDAFAIGDSGFRVCCILPRNDSRRVFRWVELEMERISHKGRRVAAQWRLQILRISF